MPFPWTRFPVLLLAWLQLTFAGCSDQAQTSTHRDPTVGIRQTAQVPASQHGTPESGGLQGIWEALPEADADAEERQGAWLKAYVVDGRPATREAYLRERHSGRGSAQAYALLIICNPGVYSYTLIAPATEVWEPYTLATDEGALQIKLNKTPEGRLQFIAGGWSADPESAFQGAAQVAENITAARALTVAGLTFHYEPNAALIDGVEGCERLNNTGSH